MNDFFVIQPQPSIFPFGIRVDEPVTTLTDLLVSAVCFYAFWRMIPLAKTSKVHIFMKWYFFTMGLATTMGGLIGHAFLYQLSFAWKLPGWLTSMFSIAFIERAVIEKMGEVIPRKWKRRLTWVNMVELSFFIMLTFSTLDFFWVEAHSAYGLLVIVSTFSWYTWRKTGNEGSKLFMVGVGWAAISALIFMQKWGIHTWFNHIDLSHVTVTIAMLTFYKGAKKF